MNAKIEELVKELDALNGQEFMFALANAWHTWLRDAALRSTEQVGAPRETAWLIEAPAGRWGTGYFWRGVAEYEEWGTLEHAVRFARKEDAERIIASLQRAERQRIGRNIQKLEACEHMWPLSAHQRDSIPQEQAAQGTGEYQVSSGPFSATNPAAQVPESVRTGDADGTKGPGSSLSATTNALADERLRETEPEAGFSPALAGPDVREAYANIMERVLVEIGQTPYYAKLLADNHIRAMPLPGAPHD